MPFQSEAQRRFMWANHPEIAQRWTNEGKGYVAGRKEETKGASGPNRGMPIGSSGEGVLPYRMDKERSERIRRAAFQRTMGGQKASGKTNFPPNLRGGVKMPQFGVHGKRSAKEV